MNTDTSKTGRNSDGSMPLTASLRMMCALMSDPRVKADITLAAERLEALTAENERLRGALSVCAHGGLTTLEKGIRARAALEGKHNE